MSDEFAFTDVVLDEFLATRTKIEFERMACHVRSDLPASSAIDECEKWIRRRAVRRSDYEMEGWVRNERSNLPWTWIEERVMAWAFKESAETRPGAEVTEEYIAAFLQRNVDEVKKKKNTKHGIQGFF